MIGGSAHTPDKHPQPVGQRPPDFQSLHRQSPVSSNLSTDTNHRPPGGPRRRGRPPGPQRRPGGGPATNHSWEEALSSWHSLSGREQILLAASTRLDLQLQEHITLERICRELELDARNLTAAFKQFHGCTMSTYLQQLRARCLFHGIATEPRASLASQFRRFGLGPTPSERRVFRRLFGLSIEAHRDLCGRSCLCALPNRGPATAERPSALGEALAKLSVQPLPVA